MKMPMIVDDFSTMCKKGNIVNTKLKRTALKLLKHNRTTDMNFLKNF